MKLLKDGKTSAQIKQAIADAGFSYTDRAVEEIIAWAEHAAVP